MWEPNRIWIWDVTHFTRARRCVFAIVDMVSRKWIATLVSVEETATQVAVVFDAALIAEDLTELLTAERLDLALDDPVSETPQPKSALVTPTKRTSGVSMRPLRWLMAMPYRATSRTGSRLPCSATTLELLAMDACRMPEPPSTARSRARSSP